MLVIFGQDGHYTATATTYYQQGEKTTTTTQQQQQQQQQHQQQQQQRDFDPLSTLGGVKKGSALPKTGTMPPFQLSSSSLSRPIIADALRRMAFLLGGSSNQRGE